MTTDDPLSAAWAEYRATHPPDPDRPARPDSPEEIRARLDAWEYDHGADDCGEDCAVVTGVAALRAVLDLCARIRADGHRPHSDMSARILSSAIADQFERTIAAALGVTPEADRA